MILEKKSSSSHQKFYLKSSGDFTTIKNYRNTCISKTSNNLTNAKKCNEKDKVQQWSTIPFIKGNKNIPVNKFQDKGIKLKNTIIPENTWFRIKSAYNKNYCLSYFTSLKNKIKANRILSSFFHIKILHPHAHLIYFFKNSHPILP